MAGGAASEILFPVFMTHRIDLSGRDFVLLLVRTLAWGINWPVMKIGLFSGMAMLSERPGWRDFAALGFIVAAMSTVLLPARRI